MSRKVRVTKELIERAERSFAANPTQATGEEFTRAELRALERKGIIRKKPGKADRGMIRIFWASDPVNLAAGLKVTRK